MGAGTHTDMNNNVVIGAYAGDGWGNVANADNVIIGHAAGSGAMTAASAGTVAIGKSALNALTEGIGNTAVGKNALLVCAASDYNTAVGQDALAGVNGTGDGYNVAVGYRAGISITDGKYNTAIGTNALYNEDQGDGCTAVGSAALYTQNGGDAVLGNTGVGQNAGYYNNTGTNGTFVGHLAGQGTTETAHSNNTAVGKSSLYAVTTGPNNTAIGIEAGNSITSGDSNTSIGAGSDCAATVDNQIAIGNGAVTDAANRGRWGNSSVSQNNIQTDWTVDSDRRIKKDIEDSDIGLSFVNSLKPRKFKKIHPSEYDAELLEKRYKKGGYLYDDDKDEVIKDEFDEERVWDGLIAQEVKESMDNLGVEFSGWGEESNGKQGITYSTLVTPLIKAVQELSAKVEELEAKLK